MTETFQITPEQAAAYESLFVPALFAQWTAPMMVDWREFARGSPSPGRRLRHRSPGPRGGRPGRRLRSVVVGCDLNPAMLEVAARVRPDIEWREGDVSELPFADGSFDTVLCQSAVFFFPDVARQAFAEMARVVRRGGVVAIQTYAALADQSGFGELETIVARHRATGGDGPA